MSKKYPITAEQLKYPIAIVVWSDSCEPGDNAEVEANEIPEPQVIVQAGHLVKETREYISIAGAWKPDLKTYDYVISIPRHAIRRIERLNFLPEEN